MRWRWYSSNGSTVPIDGTDRRRKPKRMWLAYVGQTKLTLERLWRLYMLRFSVEHLYRFLKQRLYWMLPRLATPERADRWSALMGPMMTELYLAGLRVVWLLLLGPGSFAGAAQAQWIPVPDLPAGPVNALAVHQDTLLAATDTLVYVSLDQGRTWTASARLPQEVAVVYTIQAHDGAIYAGTLGQGVFRSRDAGRAACT